MLKKLLIIVMISNVSFEIGINRCRAAENLIITTATTGGTYYPVGVAIGTLISMKLSKDHHITATAITSAGSAENIQMMKNKEAHMAILQSLFGLDVYNGTGQYEGEDYKEFRSITQLWENVEHFTILNKYVKNGTVEDLKELGKKFSIGKRGSGTEVSGCTILKTLGIDPDGDFIAEYLGYMQSAQAMMDGRVGGMNTPAGVPAAAVTQLFAQMGTKKIRVLEFTDEHPKVIQKKYPIWDRYIVKAGTYPGQNYDIKTLSQPNFLAVRSEISEETVYLITKTIYENLPFLVSIHKATKDLHLERATRGLPIPLHPGALRYYREKGVRIPQHLIGE